MAIVQQSEQGAHTQTVVTDRWSVTGAQVLRGGDWSDEALAMAGGQVVDSAVLARARRVDGRGCRLLPGIVDIHGDAFERELYPRAGVACDEAVALASSEAQLLAHGITTFFWSITDSFEPGLRSRATARHLIGLLEKRRGAAAIDHRIHLRHERAQVEGHAELLGWLQAGRVQLLSLNDHLPAADDAVNRRRYLAGLARRAAMDADEAERFLHEARERGVAGFAQCDELAEYARACALPLASHDDRDPTAVARSLARGIELAEFPMTAAAAAASRAGGATVLYGAPNLVRGHSHVGAVSVRDLVADGLVDALCSDYHWPSLLRAPFLAVELGLVDLATAWQWVASAPAAAVGCTDRGHLWPGYRADAILVAGASGSADAVRAVWSAGRLVYLRDPWRLG